MNAKFRIVIPASAAVAALLLTGCADKPIRVPGGTFVEEPYTGETTTKTHTVISNGEEITDTEVIFIDDEVPVGPVEDKTQAGKQDGASAAQGGDTSAQQGDATGLQPVDQEQAAKSNAPEGSVEYKVVKGDTLWGIGMVYGVSVARLAEINSIDEKAPLKVGQVLMIPPDAKNAVGKPVEKKTEPKTETKAETKPATATTTKPATSTKAQPVAKDGETLYVVKSGDNLSTIAYRHHVKLADLVAANKVDPKATLRVGQTLVIPAATAKAASSSTTTTKTATTTATTTTTKTETKTETKAATATTTKPATTTSTPKAGEGTGGVVEPIGGSMAGTSAPASTPATVSTPVETAKPATATTSAPALDPVSSLSDADIIAIPINSESTLEEVAEYHDRNLQDLIRLNPEFKPGQKIPAGTAIKMPLF